MDAGGTLATARAARDQERSVVAELLQLLKKADNDARLVLPETRRGEQEDIEGKQCWRSEALQIKVMRCGVTGAVGGLADGSRQQ